jgi:hypothetical protein
MSKLAMDLLDARFVSSVQVQDSKPITVFEERQHAFVHLMFRHPSIMKKVETLSCGDTELGEFNIDQWGNFMIYIARGFTWQLALVKAKSDKATI